MHQVEQDAPPAFVKVVPPAAIIIGVTGIDPHAHPLQGDMTHLANHALLGQLMR